MTDFFFFCKLLTSFAADRSAIFLPSKTYLSVYCSHGYPKPTSTAILTLLVKKGSQKDRKDRKHRREGGTVVQNDTDSVSIRKVPDSSSVVRSDDGELWWPGANAAHDIIKGVEEPPLFRQVED